VEKHLRPFNLDLHDASKASPTIDETGVYVGSDSGWFWKLSHSGETLWSLYLPGSDNGIHGTAAVDEQKVYIGAYNGFMYALNKMTGALVWAAPVGNYIGASPLLAEGKLFISVETYHPDGFLVGLDVNTGQTLWTSEWFRGHSHSSPSYDKDQRALIVGANSGRVFSIDAETGKTNWQVQLGGPVKGTALIWDGKAFLSSWDKHYYALDLKTGATVWKVFVGGRNQSSLSLVPGLGLGLANNKVGDLMALDLKSGEFVWRMRHGDPNHQFSVLITEDRQKPDRYLAWSRCKEFQLCVVDAASGKLLQNLDLPGSFTGVPVPYKDRLYISLDKDAGFLILK
jgi:outer membrane protein assembly factor BamB